MQYWNQIDLFYMITVFSSLSVVVFYFLNLVIMLFRVRRVVSGDIASSSWDSIDRVVNFLPRLFLFLSWLTMGAYIGYSWYDLARPPFKSFNEMFIFLSWTSLTLFVIWEMRFRLSIYVRSVSSVMALFGFLVTSAVFLFMLYSIEQLDPERHLLPPSLQHWVFIPHVVTATLAYGSAVISCIAGLLVLGNMLLQYLFKSSQNNKKNFFLGLAKHVEGAHLNLDLEHIAFRSALVTVILILVGPLALGSWWGKIAWTDYWFWDPKEVWALIIFLFGLVYIHFRRVIWMPKGRERRTASGFPIGRLLSASMAVILLGTVLFTLMGMHLLPSAETSEHIYTTP